MYAPVEQALQASVNSIAQERALSAAREALKGLAPDAWECATTIGSAADSASATRDTRVALFSVAVKHANKMFALERSLAGATEDEQTWLAFRSAASVVRNALEFGVFDAAKSKGAMQKAIKAARETVESSAYALAQDMGMVPHETTIESLSIAFQQEREQLQAEIRSMKDMLQAAGSTIDQLRSQCAELTAENQRLQALVLEQSTKIKAKAKA